MRDRRVLTLTLRDVPVTDIAAQLGISVTHVFRIRRRLLGPKASPHRFSAAELERVEVMLADGCSITEVARTLGVWPSSLNRRFRGRGWTPRQVAEFGALRYTVRNNSQIIGPEGVADA